MIKKFLVLMILILTTSCVTEFILNGGKWPDKDDISLRLLTDLGENKGNLISLGIIGKNFPIFYPERCQEFSDFALTYSVNFKTTLETQRRQAPYPEFQFINKNGTTKGRFKINKSDIYLIHDNKKLHPTIYWREYEYDSIASSSVSYPNYQRYGTLYAKFDLPCTKLLDPGTKLVISKIYKDDKVIKSNIEFSFIKSSDNQGYSIWLE